MMNIRQALKLFLQACCARRVPDSGACPAGGESGHTYACTKGDGAEMAVDPQQAAVQHSMERIVWQYPPEQRYILAIMQDLQKEFNYLPREALSLTADHVQVPLGKVYSMATFYKAFSLTPRGRINFKACDGTACHIKGSLVIIDELQKCLGIKPGETTADGEFSLETVNCLGACAIAPVLVANHKVHAKVTATAVREIIKTYGGRVDEPVAN